MTAPSASLEIAGVFNRCKTENRAALIPYLVAGDPDPQSSVALLCAAGNGRADIIEIGIPYSDPLADGPTIQRASQRALAAGMTFGRALDLAAKVKERTPKVPLIGFTYFNPVLQHGLENTARDFSSHGLRGIIVPDLPPAEARPLIETFASNQLSVTLLVAPTTPDDRAAQIASLCNGFVYVVSRMGVTGADRRLADVREHVERLRKVTDKPLAVGFGVSTPLDAAAVASVADGVIVGSALIERAHSAYVAHGIDGAVEAVETYCSDLAACCRRPKAAALPRERSTV